MNTATEEQRGHNNPPEILPVLPLAIEAEAIKDSIIAARDAAKEASDAPPFDAGKVTLYSANVASFCDACGAWSDLGKINSTEQSERLTDFVAGARGLAKRIDDARTAEKVVHDNRGKAVQKAYVPLLDKLDRVLKMMKEMQADWLRRENARIAEERAEQARIAAAKAEAAALELAAAEARNDVSGVVDAEAAVKAAEDEVKAAARPVKVGAGSSTGGGRTMALRKTKFAQIDKIRSVFIHFENHPDVIETLQRLSDQAVRAGETVPGTTTYEKETAA